MIDLKKHEEVKVKVLKKSLTKRRGLRLSKNTRNKTMNG
jgi:hypothetical protein